MNYTNTAAQISVIQKGNENGTDGILTIIH